MIDRIFGYKINFNFQEPLQRFPLRPLPDAIPSIEEASRNKFKHIILYRRAHILST